MKKLFATGSLILFAAMGGGCAKQSEAPAPQAQVPAPQAEKPAAEAPKPSADAAKPGTTSGTGTTTAPAAKPIAKPTPKPATKPTPAYQVVNITTEGMSPRIIAVFEGDGVTWINKDRSGHAVRSDNALLWDSGNIPAGGKYSHVFPSAGTYAYSDGTNQAKGTVVVNARPK